MVLVRRVLLILNTLCLVFLLLSLIRTMYIVTDLQDEVGTLKIKTVQHRGFNGKVQQWLGNRLK